MTGRELKEEMLTELDILLSEEELLKLWGVTGTSGNGMVMFGDPVKVIRDIREDVAGQEQIYTHQICVSGKKQDILDYAAAVGAVGIGIDRVILSQWSR